jgi:hypothetical protein
MSTTRCQACGVRIAGRPAVCPGCGARLKTKVRSPEDDDGPPRKKKRKKKAGPNWALLAAGGGGLAIAIAVAVMVAMILERPKRPKEEPGGPTAANVGAGQPGGAGVVDPGPKWLAKADPPKAAHRPKDDLAISIQGEPLFASGQAPFVADLDGLTVYDLRTGERAVNTKAIEHAHSTGRGAGDDSLVALGPDGKTLAVKVTSTIGTGRNRAVTSEAVVYRLGQDTPIAKIPVGMHIDWMEFGRDENQLLVLSVMPGGGFSAMAYDVKQPAAAGSPPNGVSLDIPRTPIRWRQGFHTPEALAVSPGRNFLAVGEGRSVDLVQLSDGKLAGRFDLPGDCVSVAFSEDGAELTAYSRIPPPKRVAMPTQYQWSTFSLADGKKKSGTQVAGGPYPGPIVAAGPKPGLAIHSDGDKVTVTDTRVSAPAYSTAFHAIRAFDSDRLLGYDKNARQVVVRRIDADELAAGEKAINDAFGPRPATVAADRASLPKPSAPTGWAVPVDPGTGEKPNLVKHHKVSGGADFVMPWAGGSMLSALTIQRVETPRDRYPLQWLRVDLTSGKAESPIDLWPSVLPPGEIPPMAGYGAVLADQTFDGARIAVRDAATPSRVDVWDKSGKRLVGFVPYGPETAVDALVWAGDNRLITRGGGKLTGWEIPGAKAVFEFMGYGGAGALSPTRKWIALQSDKHLDVYDTATGKPLGRAELSNPGNKLWHGFAVAPDGLQLAAIELVRAGGGSTPCIWGIATWDLRTGKNTASHRLFGGYADRVGTHVQWLGAKMLLAGGTDVIDLESKATTVSLGLNPPMPLPSPDGRYWGVRADSTAPNGQRTPLESIFATDLEEPLRTMPKVAAADIVFRDGTPVDVDASTGDNGRDAVIRSIFSQMLSGEGYGSGKGGWKLSVTAQRTAGNGATLETPKGDRIRIPGISGKVQLLDPAGEVVWEAPASGGWDMNHSKYKTGKEDLGPMGGSITHFNFGLRNPEDAMADEAWDDFMNSVRGSGNFPRMFARVNGKVVALPIKVPVAK